MRSSFLRRFGVTLMCAFGSLGLAGGALAADHVDLPQNGTGTGATTVARPDASITDFFAFVNGNKLVMILDLNPFLSPDVQNYVFPTDVKYRFNVDTNAQITIGNDLVSKEFGGVIAAPETIREDYVFEVTFNAQNGPQLNVTGANTTRCRNLRAATRVFAGLRAEAFIFSPFVRNNIAGIVLEVPLSTVVESQSKLLLWATATVDTPAGPFTELGGRALRSQFGTPAPNFQDLNALHPSQHKAAGFVRPDVVIIDVSKPTLFPNGRNLSDDVVTVVDGFTLLPDTDHAAAGLEVSFCEPGGMFYPCPVPASATADDVRILGRFPYLGRPYRPGDGNND